jgi:hypothetical protein
MASPNLASASSLTKEELMDWSLAEAKGTPPCLCAEWGTIAGLSLVESSS